MPKSVYIASTGRDSGKSIIVFGMMEYLLGRSHRIGYFKPIATDSTTGRDTMSLVSEHWKQAMAGRVVSAFTQEEADEIQARDGVQALHKGILEAYSKLEKECDFVLCSGTNFSRSTSAFEFEFNIDIAKNLGASLLPVISGHDISTKSAIERLRSLLAMVEENHTPVLAAVVNRVPPETLTDMRADLTKAFRGKPPVFVVPNEPSLSRPTVRDIADVEGVTRFSVTQDTLVREVCDIKVAAMGVPNFLGYIVEGELVITPGDRADILTACLLAHRSPNYPDIAGVVIEQHPHAWIFFVVFIVLTTFTTLNLLFGIIVDAMEKAKEEDVREQMAEQGMPVDEESSEMRLVMIERDIREIHAMLVAMQPTMTRPAAE